MHLGKARFLLFSYTSTVGLLDVFGFECFQRNSFEQLCINFANERLHAFFMEQVFMDELALYTREGLPLPEVNPPNNAEVCSIFDKGHLGAFQLLDSQSRAAKPSDAAFSREMHDHHAANTFFGKSDAPEMAHLRLTKDEAFGAHTARTCASAISHA